MSDFLFTILAFGAGSFIIYVVFGIKLIFSPSFWKGEADLTEESTFCFAIAVFFNSFGLLFAILENTLKIPDKAVKSILIVLILIFLYFVSKIPKKQHVYNIEDAKKLSNKFCKKCGGKIDINTNQCLDCNHQYFKFNIFVVLTTVLGILFSFSMYKFQNKQEDFKRVRKQQEEKIETLQTEVESYKTTITAMREVLDKYQQKSDFLDEHIAIVVSYEDDAKYHKYGCKYIQNKDFWAYNTEAAEDRGFEPCKVCH